MVNLKKYFGEKKILISIFMSPFDVHINRNPISGTVKYYQYHKGKFLVAWHPKSSLLNERTTTVIENNKITLIEERIGRIQNDTGTDNTQSIAQQVAIRDGAWDRVQGDIDYAQGQIDDIREQLRIDVASQDTRLETLDQAVNDLRNKGILLSTDGPFNNVIKIKPPLVFTKENANQVFIEIRSFLINENKK